MGRVPLAWRSDLAGGGDPLLGCELWDGRGGGGGGWLAAGATSGGGGFLEFATLAWIPTPWHLAGLRKVQLGRAVLDFLILRCWFGFSAYMYQSLLVWVLCLYIYMCIYIYVFGSVALVCVSVVIAEHDGLFLRLLKMH